MELLFHSTVNQSVYYNHIRTINLTSKVGNKIKIWNYSSVRFVNWEWVEWEFLLLG